LVFVFSKDIRANAFDHKHLLTSIIDSDGDEKGYYSSQGLTVLFRERMNN